MRGGRERGVRWGGLDAPLPAPLGSQAQQGLSKWTMCLYSLFQMGPRGRTAELKTPKAVTLHLSPTDSQPESWGEVRENSGRVE